MKKAGPQMLSNKVSFLFLRQTTMNKNASPADEAAHEKTHKDTDNFLVTVVHP
jgi:hypothetical protein